MIFFIRIGDQGCSRCHKFIVETTLTEPTSQCKRSSYDRNHSKSFDMRAIAAQGTPACGSLQAAEQCLLPRRYNGTSMRAIAQEAKGLPPVLLALSFRYQGNLYGGHRRMARKAINAGKRLLLLGHLQDIPTVNDVLTALFRSRIGGRMHGGAAYARIHGADADSRTPNDQGLVATHYTPTAASLSAHFKRARRHGVGKTPHGAISGDPCAGYPAWRDPARRTAGRHDTPARVDDISETVWSACRRRNKGFCPHSNLHRRVRFADT